MNDRAKSAARISVVDDDPNVRSLIRGLLVHTLRLPEPECHAGPAVARRSLARNPPQLLFLDIRFKGQATGLHLLSDLRRELRDTAVCIVSVYADPGTIFEAWRQGVHGYLHKPVDPREFERAVPLLLNGDISFCHEAQAVILRHARLPPPPVSAGAKLPPLNETRRGILACLAAGLHREDEIARLMRCSESTVVNEISKLYSLLDASRHHKLARHHRHDLALWAREHVESLCTAPIALPHDHATPEAPPLLDTFRLLQIALTLRERQAPRSTSL